MATLDVGLQDTISEQKFKPCFCSVMPLFNESCVVPGDTEKNNAEQKSDQFAVCGISDTVYDTVYRKKYNERHAIQTSNDVTVWTDPSYINIGPYQYPLGSTAETAHHSESAHLSDGVPPSTRELSIEGTNASSGFNPYKAIQQASVDPGTTLTDLYETVSTMSKYSGLDSDVVENSTGSNRDTVFFEPDFAHFQIETPKPLPGGSDEIQHVERTSQRTNGLGVQVKRNSQIMPSKSQHINMSHPLTHGQSQHTMEVEFQSHIMKKTANENEDEMKIINPAMIANSTPLRYSLHYASEESLAKVEGEVGVHGTDSGESDYDCQISRNSSVTFRASSPLRFQNRRYSSEESLAKVEGEVGVYGTDSGGSDYDCQMSRNSSPMFENSLPLRFQHHCCTSQERLARVEGEVHGCDTSSDGSDHDFELSRNSSLMFEKFTPLSFQNRCYTSKDSLAKVEDPIHLYVIDDDANTFYDEIKINSPAESGELPQIWRNHDDACKEKQVQRDDNDNESETVYICTTSADSAIRYDSRVQYPIMNTTHSHVARPTEQTTLGLKLNQSGSHVTNMLNDRPTWYAKLPAYVDPFKPLANKHSPENNVTDVSDKSGILNANHTGYEEGNVEDCPKVKESPEETCIMVEECISCRDEKKKKKWLRPVLIALGATSASILVSAMTLLMIVHL